jgi:quercetin dioxygenase-like cupin family protein
MSTRLVLHTLLGIVLATPPAALAQQLQTPPAIVRTEVLQQTLPPGNFRTVQSVVIELAPGAAAPKHRHDVAVMAYVLEGTVENQFGDGPVLTHRTGESWWEAPGTVHSLARNPSASARARLLIIYIGEEGKAASVRIN